MALWGNNDACRIGGTVALNYSTGVVTGTGTTFGETGAIQEGDVIRFGKRGGTYMGDACHHQYCFYYLLYNRIHNGSEWCSIAGTTFTVSQLPKSSILDQTYSETNTDSTLWFMV